jgi:hypothetical protein
MSLFEISDITAIYIKGASQSGMITRNTPLPLSQIQDVTSLFCSDAKDKLNSLIVKLMNVKSECLKPDPVSGLLTEIELAKCSNYDKKHFINDSMNTKLRSNQFPDLNKILLTMAEGVEASTLNGVDAVLYDENWKPRALIFIDSMPSLTVKKGKKIYSQMSNYALNPSSVYHGCEMIYVSRIPKSDIYKDNKQIRQMSLQQFYENFCSDKDAYVNSLLLIARIMSAHDRLPADYDMRNILNLLS